MQLVFYMTPDEEAQFVRYILTRGGYFMPSHWPTYPMPVLAEELPFSKGKADPMRELIIFKEDLFSKATAVSEDWKQFWPAGGVYISAARPGVEFTRSCVDGKQLFPGRLWMGASISSFAPPSGQLKISEPLQLSYKRLENFYKACCNYLRKGLSKHMPGWYIGSEVENYCAAKRLSRAPSTHL